MLSGTALAPTPAQLILRQKHRNATKQQGKEHTEPLPASLAIKPVGLHSREKTNLSLEIFSSVLSGWGSGNTLEGQNDKNPGERVTNPAVIMSLHMDTALSEDQLNSSCWGNPAFPKTAFPSATLEQQPQIPAPPVLHTKLSKE